MNRSSASSYLPSVPNSRWLSVFLAVFFAVGFGACTPSEEVVESDPVPETREAPSEGDSVAPDAVPTIVQRSLEYHGSQKLEESTIELTVTSKSGSFRISSQPGPVFDYAVFSEDDGKPSVRRHTNKADEPEVSHTQDGAPVEIADPQKVRDFVSARHYFLFFPYRLLDSSSMLTDLGMEAWEGRDLHKVRLSFKAETSTNAAQSYLFWFDPDSAQLEQFAYSFDGGVRFRKLINQRRVEGVLVADQENYAHNADVSVDIVTPEFAPSMELLSTVRLTEVSIAPR